MAPTYVLAYNTGDSPVVVDPQGRTLGGHEWGPARRGDMLDVAANAGRVATLTTIDEESASDAAKAAYHQAAEWTAAAEKWAGVPLDTVRETALAHATDGNINLPPAARAAGTLAEAVAVADRVELIDLMVRADIPIPARAKRASSPQE